MNIYVGNLPFRASSDELQNIFAAHGTVARVTIPVDRETGRSRGFAFVEMPNDAEASEAINSLNGFEFMGRMLKVNEARPVERNGGGGGRGDNRFRERRNQDY
ncbi:MAG: RNA-binding protein [Leptonema illini]|uniref:RNP-1 like RNA-binding protein n=2 Tax=Leptonema illini TaxID=183 RepID=H2CHV7_9LEPT|nr:RNA-binding protein [Leptonema illini]EHQ06979.1 RNP-1 like RNA-binding protein [Leptonema illini DSM 21528]KAB2934419.1 MAG: RNA-binding protein [Leptonema illini]PKL33769.1 MAG: RNA-binding protein [Spirochaetae bacterium HGW-Spirochaetae-10]